jgi:hypothetical protein
VVYDGDSVDVSGCAIQRANEGKPCTVSLLVIWDISLCFRCCCHSCFSCLDWNCHILALTMLFLVDFY